MWGKLLGIASIGEALSSLHLARKFVAELAVIVMLAIVGAILTGAMVIAALWECHELLMRHGLDADMSALVTGVLGILILAAIAGTIVYKINRVRRFPLRLGSALPLAPLQSILRGFYQGLSKKDPL